MSTAAEREQMAAEIVKFEERRVDGHIAVYHLPANDGGGTYEVAGINDKYNKETVDVLVSLINQGRYAEAEALAADYIAQDTDRVSSWSKIPALEFYFRDCNFNRGFRGASRILQRAVSVTDDGAVGSITRNALAAVEGDVAALLDRLREARESYERDVVGYRANFWQGLVNRWNNALIVAKTFPMSATG